MRNERRETSDEKRATKRGEGNPMEDRRSFPRKALGLKVICRDPNAPGHAWTTKSIDISQGGIRLRFTKPIINHNELNITIRKPFWEGNIEARGQVAWVHNNMPGDINVGIRFTDAPWTQLCSLLNNIK